MSDFLKIRGEELAQAIAFYVCNPADAIEIGGVSSQLLSIIKLVTRRNRPLRMLVADWLGFFIDNKETIVKEYVDNYTEALNDYDNLFYN